MLPPFAHHLSVLVSFFSCPYLVQDKGIIHGDLHIGNVLMKQEDGVWQPVIFDFDRSNHVNDESESSLLCVKQQNRDAHCWFMANGGTHRCGGRVVRGVPPRDPQ